MFLWEFAWFEFLKSSRNPGRPQIPDSVGRLTIRNGKHAKIEMQRADNDARDFTSSRYPQLIGVEILSYLDHLVLYPIADMR
jgi:hypothetical protein